MCQKIWICIQEEAAFGSDKCRKNHELNSTNVNLYPRNKKVYPTNTEDSSCTLMYLRNWISIQGIQKRKCIRPKKKTAAVLKLDLYPRNTKSKVYPTNTEDSS